MSTVSSILPAALGMVAATRIAMLLRPLADIAGSDRERLIERKARKVASVREESFLKSLTVVPDRKVEEDRAN